MQKVQGLSRITDVAQASYFNAALDEDGKVWAWGNYCPPSDFDPGGALHPTPTLVQGLEGTVALRGSRNGIYAVKLDGTVWGWGSAGSLPQPCTPTRIADYRNREDNPSHLTEVIDGSRVLPTGESVLYLRENGEVWGQGGNTFGQLACYNDFLAAPLCDGQGALFTGATAVASGAAHSLVLLADGTVKAMGHNRWGQLGNGQFGGLSQRWPVPQVVQGLSGVKIPNRYR